MIYVYIGIGAILLFMVLIVYSCCVVSGRCSRQEERWDAEMWQEED